MKKKVLDSLVPVAAITLVAGIALLLMVYALRQHTQRREQARASYGHQVLETTFQLDAVQHQWLDASQNPGAPGSQKQDSFKRPYLHLFTKLSGLLQQDTAYQHLLADLQASTTTLYLPIAGNSATQMATPLPVDSFLVAAGTLNQLQNEVYKQVRAIEQNALTNQQTIERIRLVTLCMLSVALLIFFYVLYHDYSSTRALQRQYAFSAGILQQLPDPAATTNTSFELEQWNSSFAQLLAGNGATATGDIRSRLPGWQQNDTEALQNALAKDGCWKREWLLRQKGQSARVLELHVSALQNAGNQQLGTLWVVKDITARKQQLEQLSRKAEKLEINLNTQVHFLQQVINKLPEGMFQVDHEGRYLHINEQGAEFLPFKVSDVLGKKMWDVFPALKGTDFEQAFQKACNTGAEQFMEFHSPVSRKVYQVAFIPIAGMVNIVFRDLSELKKVQNEMTSLSGALVEAREAERHRISAELHDDLGQQLTSNKIFFNYLMAALQLPDGPLRRQFNQLERQMDTAINTVRHLNRTITNQQVEDLGLFEVMQQDAAQFAENFGIPLQFENEADGLLLDNKTAVPLYQIFSEALTNIARHAAATQVNITLGLEEDYLFLNIQDDGRGFDASTFTETSLGLHSMEERARSLQGTCQIHSKPGKGTTVRVQVPLLL